MPDWTKSMEQSFEYYTVEPTTMADVRRLNIVKTATFNRDADTETLGSATIDVTESTGETYIRGYLKTIQNGITEKFPLGTVLVQTPSMSFNGKIMDVSMDAYTPLIELKENRPPLGYTIRKGARIMDEAYTIINTYARAPVTKVGPKYENDASGEEIDKSAVLEYDFVANIDDTWLTFVKDLIAKAEYELGLDEQGHILFLPKQDMASLQPVWTFDDSNSSILYPDITIDHDLYGIPNVVEVSYFYGNEYIEVRVTNDDENSITSVQNRGREIIYRDTDPSLSGYQTKDQVENYAKKLLEALSTVQYSITYSHAYCPVRVGDCVRLNYTRAGITNIKAKVISQAISCTPGCPVEEKAVFTNKLWR